MKFQVEKANLIQVLQKVQSITDKKSNMPILGNCLLKATADGLVEFSATDLELNFWTKIAAEVSMEGQLTVSARKLLEIIREIPQEQVMLESLPNSKVLIRAGRSRFELSTIPAEDFPYINFYQDMQLLNCNTAALRQALQKTFYSIPVEEDTFTAPGLLWHGIGDKGFRFVSTDGHRLAYYEVEADAFPGISLDKGIIVPRKAVQEIIRLLEKETEAAIGVDEKSLVVRTQNAFLSTLLLDAEFPEYEMIIPAERPNGFSIETESFYPALKRVAVVTDVTYRHVRFNISKNSIELESGNPELGNANDVLDIDFSGSDFTIAFNVKYVLDSISVMEGKTIRFEWVDQFHGGIFLSPDEPGYLSLIMPMVV
ncbi:MAG: DNA polymerase III subunit beta [Desulfobacteraceae bacterium]|nr:DNA polymerase III subunit beta [Desulfobacteraceae bacterium]